MTDQILFIALSDLRPHPKNPRLSPNQELVDQIAAQLIKGFDSAHALLVRPMDGYYEIVSGHHRTLAAKQAGLSEVPCWVREMTDDEAYMQLVLCNTQSELHPLEEGIHALNSGISGSEYARQIGKPQRTVAVEINSARVYEFSTRVLTERATLEMEFASMDKDIDLFKKIDDDYQKHYLIFQDESKSSWRNLAEIHAAPEWMWTALAQQMITDGWTVQKTIDRVAAVKDVQLPPEWANAGLIADDIVQGNAKTNLPEMLKGKFESVRLTDDDLKNEFVNAVTDANLHRLSELSEIANTYEKLQQQRDQEKREAEIAQQREIEKAQQKTKRLRENCSLEEWKALSDLEKTELLNCEPSGSSWNTQTSGAIEWAQHSWNPITGCKHECPYCYARDIVYQKGRQHVFPNGFEPTFRPNALAVPPKPPMNSLTDTRFKNVFTCSMADLFGRWVPNEWIEAVLNVMRENPQWNFLCLTKFPKRMREFDIPKNTWMGTTIDLQARVKSAEDAFEGLDCEVKWLSIEPMLEDLTFTRLELFDWVVVGGSSPSSQTPAWQPPARWVHHLITQCDAHKIPVYQKTNLGNAKRILEMPKGLIMPDEPELPDTFKYLGGS